MTKELPNHARAVIIGGGVIGCSVAYHLAKLGWSDVVLLERKQLTCGTTWHAAGLIGQMRNSTTMAKLAKYTAELYRTLEDETGISTGLRQNGSLYTALTSDRMEEHQRMADNAMTYGLEAHMLSAKEVRDHYPLLETGDMVGGMFVPSDGQLDPANVALAMAKGARKRGAKTFENVKVTAIHQHKGRVTGISTDQGDVTADFVVNCAGMWGRDVGAMAGVNIPLHACEHFYIVTEAIKDLPRDLPVLRVQDECAYYKEDAGKILLGAFEPKSKPWGMGGIPEDFCFDQLPEDFEHFEPILEAAVARLPILESAGIHTFFNGPESFTHDDRYLLGEAPELRDFYVACGFNSIGIQSAGGAGLALAEWMEAGTPTMDLWDVDIRRVMPCEGNRAFLKDRVTETLGLLYADHYPYRQFETGRNLRQSPLHERLAERGACFGQTAGWERPNWYAPEGVEPKYEYGWKRPNWFPHAAQEHKAVRETVALFDMTSFAKFRVEGRDAEAILQRICANDIAVEPGRIVYTQWLNGKGGIEADLTVTRLSDTVFLIVTGGAVSVRDFNWLQRHIPEDAHCIATDVTSGEAVLAVMGPKSRDLLQPLTPTDLSNEAFPFARAKTIEVGMGNVRAHRITYVGELGWELYVPTDMARLTFDTLMAGAGDHGLKLAGMHVLDGCRMEKAYRHFGHDITDADHVLEAGLGFAVKTGKTPSKYGDFIGRAAVEERREAGLSKRMMQFRLTDPEPLLYHGEPILRDGEVAGYLTSGNYGHHLGGAIGLGYVACERGEKPADILKSTYEIIVAGEKLSAQASFKPLYDPTSERVRA